MKNDDILNETSAHSKINLVAHYTETNHAHALKIAFHGKKLH